MDTIIDNSLKDKKTLEIITNLKIENIVNNMNRNVKGQNILEIKSKNMHNTNKFINYRVCSKCEIIKNFF